MVSDWLDANQEDGHRKDINPGANNKNCHGGLYALNENGFAMTVLLKQCKS